MSKTSKKARVHDPAKQAERDAITFEAVPAQFNWTNEDWGLTFLPRVRMATVALQRDPAGLSDLLSNLNREGLTPDMLDGWCETKAHLEALVKTIDTALVCSYLVLERLGYSPDNLPPSARLN